MKRCKTPLRYPGGKSRALNKIKPFLDFQGIKEYREPFLGGGSVAIHITKENPNLKIWVNDIYFPLFCFWKTLKHQGEKLHFALKELKLKNKPIEKAKKLFYESKEQLEKNIQGKQDIFEIGKLFFIVNKCSFSGLTESSSFSKSASQNNFTLNNIENVLYYAKLIKNWKITNYSYEKVLEKTNQKTFMYLDPPYAIGCNELYGKHGKLHKNFNHERFAKALKNINCKCLISYNEDFYLRDAFTNFKKTTFDLTYTMRSVGAYMKNQKARKELLLYK